MTEKGLCKKNISNLDCVNFLCYSVSAPVLSEAWEEVENPVFLLVREAPDKRSRNKRSPFNMERMREHLMKRDPGYVAWTSVTNNMDVLRGHLKEKLFVEVARRNGGGLGNSGKK